MKSEAMERFEEMARLYINGSPGFKEAILSFFANEDEQRAFLEGVGFYKLFTDEQFNNQVRDTLAVWFYNECNKAAET